MSDERKLIDLAQVLLKRGGALQSTTEGEEIDAAAISEVLERRIADEVAHADALPPSLTAKSATAVALAGAQRAIEKGSNLTDLEYASLQAIIEVTGRPAMRYDGGRVRMPPELGENDRWRVLVAVARSKINQASSCVGRISNDKGIFGTGWRAGPTTIVTNRHVLAELVSDRSLPVDQWKLDTSKHPLIDFAATDQAAGPRPFTIEAIAYCAQGNDIDLALLRVAANTGLPEPLTIGWDPAQLGALANGRVDGSAVYVVGHPFRQFGSEIVTAVFGVADGLKRWSPGYVKRIEDDKPQFAHDCSTLGGNSGSCVLTAEEHIAVGLHFGGIGVDLLTGRGTSNEAVAFGKLENHTIANILSKTGQVVHG